MYAGRIVESGPAADRVRGAAASVHEEAARLAAGDRRAAAAGEPIPGAPPDPADAARGCAFRPRCPYAAERCAEQPALREVAPGPGGGVPLRAVGAWPAPVRQESPMADLMAVRDLRGALPRAGAWRARSTASRSTWRRRRGARRGRRVGLRQVDAGAGAARARAARGRRRSSSTAGGRRTAARARCGGACRWSSRTRTRRSTRACACARSWRSRWWCRACARPTARVERALEDVGLPAARFGERYPHELSGGQRQRVAIAAALVLEPAGLICDEPVSMLDVSVRAQVLQVLQRLREERSLALLFITHDLGLAWALCDRIAVMYLGRIVEEGPRAGGHRAPAAPVHAGARGGRPDPPGRPSSARRWRAARCPTPPTSRRAAASTRAARTASSRATPRTRR